MFVRFSAESVEAYVAALDALGRASSKEHRTLCGAVASFIREEIGRTSADGPAPATFSPVDQFVATVLQSATHAARSFDHAAESGVNIDAAVAAALERKSAAHTAFLEDVLTWNVLAAPLRVKAAPAAVEMKAAAVTALLAIMPTPKQTGGAQQGDDAVVSISAEGSRHRSFELLWKAAAFTGHRTVVAGPSIELPVLGFAFIAAAVLRVADAVVHRLDPEVGQESGAGIPVDVYEQFLGGGTRSPGAAAEAQSRSSALGFFALPLSLFKGKGAAKAKAKDSDVQHSVETISLGELLFSACAVPATTRDINIGSAQQTQSEEREVVLVHEDRATASPAAHSERESRSPSGASSGTVVEHTDDEHASKACGDDPPEDSGNNETVEHCEDDQPQNETNTEGASQARSDAASPAVLEASSGEDFPVLRPATPHHSLRDALCHSLLRDGDADRTIGSVAAVEAAMAVAVPRSARHGPVVPPMPTKAQHGAAYLVHPPDAATAPTTPESQKYSPSDSSVPSWAIDAAKEDRFSIARARHRLALSVEGSVGVIAAATVQELTHRIAALGARGGAAAAAMTPAARSLVVAMLTALERGYGEKKKDDNTEWDAAPEDSADHPAAPRADVEAMLAFVAAPQLSSTATHGSHRYGEALYATAGHRCAAVLAALSTALAGALDDARGSSAAAANASSASSTVAFFLSGGGLVPVGGSSSVQATAVPDTVARAAVLALSALLQAATNGGPCFRLSSEVTAAARQHVWPALLKAAVAPVVDVYELTFSLAVRLVVHQRSDFALEIESFFHGAVLPLLESKHTSYTHKVHVVDSVLRGLCSEPQVLVDFFINFDCRTERRSVFDAVLDTLRAIALSQHPDGADTAVQSQPQASPHRAGPGSPAGSITASSAPTPQATAATLREAAAACLVTIVKAVNLWMDRFEDDAADAAADVVLAPHQTRHPEEEDGASTPPPLSLRPTTSSAVFINALTSPSVVGVDSGPSPLMDQFRSDDAAATLSAGQSPSHTAAPSPAVIPNMTGDDGRNVVDRNSTVAIATQSQVQGLAAKKAMQAAFFVLNDAGDVKECVRRLKETGALALYRPMTANGGAAEPGTSMVLDDAAVGGPPESDAVLSDAELNDDDDAEDEEDLDARAVARILHTHNHLVSKVAIGEFFSKDKAPNKTVLKYYVREHQFAGLLVDEALRHFLGGFKLAGEAQVVDRTMELFAAHYSDQNSNASDTAPKSGQPKYTCSRSGQGGARLSVPPPSTTFVLSFAVCMLNTDAHSASVARKMSFPDFVRNNRGIDDGADLPEPFLEGIYNRVTKDEIRLRLSDADSQYEHGVLRRAVPRAAPESAGLGSVPLFRAMGPVVEAMTGAVMLPLDVASSLTGLTDAKERKQTTADFAKEFDGVLERTLAVLEARGKGGHGGGHTAAVFDTAKALHHIVPMLTSCSEPLVSVFHALLSTTTSSPSEHSAPSDGPATTDENAAVLFDLAVVGAKQLVRACCRVGQAQFSDAMLDGLLAAARVPRLIEEAAKVAPSHADPSASIALCTASKKDKHGEQRREGILLAGGAVTITPRCAKALRAAVDSVAENGDALSPSSWRAVYRALAALMELGLIPAPCPLPPTEPFVESDDVADESRQSSSPDLCDDNDEKANNKARSRGASHHDPSSHSTKGNDRLETKQASSGFGWFKSSEEKQRQGTLRARAANCHALSIALAGPVRRCGAAPRASTPQSVSSTGTPKDREEFPPQTMPGRQASDHSHGSAATKPCQAHKVPVIDHTFDVTVFAPRTRVRIVNALSLIVTHDLERGRRPALLGKLAAALAACAATVSRVTWQRMWATASPAFIAAGLSGSGGKGTLCDEALSGLAVVARAFLARPEASGFRSQRDCVRSFEAILLRNPDPAAREAAVATLGGLVKTHAPRLVSGWCVVFDALAHAAMFPAAAAVTTAWSVVRRALLADNLRCLLSCTAHPSHGPASPTTVTPGDSSFDAPPSATPAGRSLAGGRRVSVGTASCMFTSAAAEVVASAIKSVASFASTPTAPAVATAATVWLCRCGHVAALGALGPHLVPHLPAVPSRGVDDGVARETDAAVHALLAHPSDVGGVSDSVHAVVAEVCADAAARDAAGTDDAPSTAAVAATAAKVTRLAAHVARTERWWAAVGWPDAVLGALLAVALAHDDLPVRLHAVVVMCRLLRDHGQAFTDAARIRNAAAVNALPACVAPKRERPKPCRGESAFAGRVPLTPYLKPTTSDGLRTISSASAATTATTDGATPRTASTATPTGRSAVTAVVSSTPHEAGADDVEGYEDQGEEAPSWWATVAWDEYLRSLCPLLFSSARVTTSTMTTTTSGPGSASVTPKHGPAPTRAQQALLQPASGTRTWAAVLRRALLDGIAGICATHPDARTHLLPPLLAFLKERCGAVVSETEAPKGSAVKTAEEGEPSAQNAEDETAPSPGRASPLLCLDICGSDDEWAQVIAFIAAVPPSPGTEHQSGVGRQVSDVGAGAHDSSMAALHFARQHAVRPGVCLDPTPHSTRDALVSFCLDTLSLVSLVPPEVQFSEVVTVAALGGVASVVHTVRTRMVAQSDPALLCDVATRLLPVIVQWRRSVEASLGLDGSPLDEERLSRLPHGSAVLALWVQASIAEGTVLHACASDENEPFARWCWARLVPLVHALRSREALAHAFPGLGTHFAAALNAVVSYLCQLLLTAPALEHRSSSERAVRAEVLAGLVSAQPSAAEWAAHIAPSVDAAATASGALSITGPAVFSETGAVTDRPLCETVSALVAEALS